MPLTVAEIAIGWFAVDRGFIDDVEISKVSAFHMALLAYLRSDCKEFLDSVNATPKLSEQVIEQMNSILKTFKETQTW